MSVVPAFQIGLWNAWIFIVPWIVVNFVLTPLLIKRKTLWKFPSYTGMEKIYLLLFFVVELGLVIYSIFLPLENGTVLFYAGFAVYLAGFAFIVLAIRTFTTIPEDKPNSTGIYRISRHPWYIGMIIFLIGIGIASASWVFLLLALIWLVPIRNALMIPEERECVERFGNAYKEYMNRTPRWVGIPKTNKIENA
jgi:protein-S-isoprenylcysteine O-methyltransferase Ste14